MRFIILLVAISLQVFVMPTSLFSQGTNENSPGGDWRDLFNGQDLSGWKQLNGRHIFEAKDGELIGTTVPGEPNGFLVTEEEYGDFILELEVHIDVLMNNSGIQFRSLSLADYQDGRVHGYQAEIDTKPQQWSGSIYDEARRGWLVTTEVNPEAKTAFKNAEWNHYRIEAIGASNRVWVNGIPTSHLIDDVTTKGFIGLQLHANQPRIDPDGSRQIRFRNIRIQTTNLQASPLDGIFVMNLIPNTLSVQEAKQGFALLWDGRTTEGWRPAGGWEISDGALREVPAEHTGDYVSEKQYGPFELVFEFKPETEGAATCGLNYFVTGEEAGDGASNYCLMAQKKLNGNGWNQGIIRVNSDNQAEYWLNGVRILTYKRGPNSPSRGHIALLHAGGLFSYRSLKIKEVK